jgi:hypothetical protein
MGAAVLEFNVAALKFYDLPAVLAVVSPIHASPPS